MAKGPEMEITGRQAVDPATQRRQEHLFRQAEGYAAQQPFQQQYGYGSSMVPGLSGMSQTGQGYLTDKILGKGAYRIQNLGFQDYQRPSTAQPGGFQYGQSGYMPGQEFTPGYQTGRYRTGMAPEGGDGSMAWGGGGVPGTDPGGGEGDGGGDLSDAELAELGLDVQPGRRARQAQYGTTPYQGQGQVPVTTPTAPAATAGLGPQGDPAAWTPWQQETWKTGAPSGMAGVNQPSYELNIFDTPDTPFGAQNLPTAGSGAQYAGREGTGGGLLQTDLNRPTSGVGIGEVEDARTATRRMLMEGPRTSDPGYKDFIGAGGWEGLSKASGVGDLLPAHTDASGKAYAAGWHGLGEAGTGTAGTTTGAITGPGSLQSDALTPWQRRDPVTGEITTPEGYVPEYDTVGAQALVPGTGETREAYQDIDVGTLADQYEGLSPEQITAARAGVEPAQISDEGYYGEGDPDAFGGASFLGGPAGFEAETVNVTDAEGNITGTRQTTPIEAYMDAGGVGAQVTQAQQDFARSLAQEESRRAAAGAWGLRGELPAREQQQQMLARISEIRRKGYTDAADRMEADLQREQAAGMQTQQLGTSAMMQMQQLEAQRQQAAAERLQQSGLAGQQLGAEASLQTQRLGVGADQRTAELALQADLANQQAQLQTGGQQAGLEAQRRESVADREAQRLQREVELKMQRQMQTQGLGADAAAQQTQNEFARRQALAGMGQDAATQQTQNEFARRQALSEMGLQAQGMGMDDQARFREQQMALAQQLGRQGMDEQAATFAASQQLQQMGATQEQRQQMQAAADYEQWLRSQEGFADEAAFLQAMQPTPGQAQYQRKPSTWGQIAGGLLAAGGTAAQAFGSDARIKDNIEYVGMENGFKTYEFNYLGRDNRYRGVMAQEVMLERPDAVEIEDGFYRVNYDAIGVQFEAV